MLQYIKHIIPKNVHDVYEKKMADSGKLLVQSLNGACSHQKPQTRLKFKMVHQGPSFRSLAYFQRSLHKSIATQSFWQQKVSTWMTCSLKRVWRHDIGVQTCSWTYSWVDCKREMKMGTAPASTITFVCCEVPDAMFVNAHAASNWNKERNKPWE